MRKSRIWVKSLGVCLAVIAVMSGAGFYLLAGSTPLVVGEVEANSFETDVLEEKAVFEVAAEFEAAGDIEAVEVFETVEGVFEAAALDIPLEAPEESVPEPAQAAVVVEEQPVVAAVDEPVFAAGADPAPPVDYRAEEKAAQVETSSVEAGEPALPGSEQSLAVELPPAAAAPAPQQALSPVNYAFGAAASYTFRMEVAVTNNGSETSNGVSVSVPLLENDSPYQSTTLQSVNFDVVSSSGRVSTFHIGDLAPGETRVITVDFNTTVRPVSINSSNDTVEKARSAFEEFAGSGNCRDLARGFINRCAQLGVTAREVVGFARPQRGAMIPGSLQGCRHSWAEFYVDGLGWVPVDLTFEYFGELPQASHIVESYADQSISINFTGGNLAATWSNAIL